MYPYHKFYIQKGYISNYNGDIINHKNVKTIDAQDLRTGMKIIKCDYPVINTKKNYNMLIMVYFPVMEHILIVVLKNNL